MLDGSFSLRFVPERKTDDLLAEVVLDSRILCKILRVRKGFEDRVVSVKRLFRETVPGQFLAFCWVCGRCHLPLQMSELQVFGRLAGEAQGGIHVGGVYYCFLQVSARQQFHVIAPYFVQVN